MSQKLARHVGRGTVWIVVDRVQGDYLCYWYTGMQDDRLVEHARAGTAAAAVDWGRARSPRVRIRMGDARTYWAGDGAVPQGYARRWTEDAPSWPMTNSVVRRDDAHHQRAGSAHEADACQSR